MGKVIRLTESDLIRLVKKVINESEEKTIKLTMTQKMKLLKSGLKPDYRQSGDLLMIVGVTQKRGSAIATIRKDEDKIVLTYRGEKKEFENISDCIDYFLDDMNSNKNSNINEIYFGGPGPDGESQMFKHKLENLNLDVVLDGLDMLREYRRNDYYRYFGDRIFKSYSPPKIDKDKPRDWF